MLLSAGLCAVLIVGCGSSKVSAPTTATVVRTVTQTVASATSPAATVTPPVATATPTATTLTTVPPTTTTAPMVTTTTASASAPGEPTIPTESYQEASSGDPGASKFPPGISGSVCTSTYIGFSGQVTGDSADAAYAIAVSGSSPLTCPEAGDLAHDYLKAPGVDPGSSQAPPARTTVDGYTCGSYWYRPAGDNESPIPYVTCEAPGAVMTIYGLEV
jgi:hypothetical protein